MSGESSVSGSGSGANHNAVAYDYNGDKKKSNTIQPTLLVFFLPFNWYPEPWFC